MKTKDNISKIILILLIIIASYLLLLTISSVSVQSPMGLMMEEMMEFSPTNPVINLISLLFAVSIGFIASLYLFAERDKEYKILRKALSNDEKRILDEIKKAGEITQDSLRFRLEWSKAKVSTILTNLDRKGLIQRERIGKTYKVSLQR